MAFALKNSLLLLSLVLGAGMVPSNAGHNEPLDSRQAHPQPESVAYINAAAEAPSAPSEETLQTKNVGQGSRTPAPAECPAGPATSIGTAWPLENGYVVTNYHVIAGSRALALQDTNGQQFSATPVLVDPANDLALLAVNSARQLPPALPLCNIEAPTGASVFTLGFPRVDRLGYSPKFTEGMISSGATPMGNTNRYLTTVSIQPGNSGGPLLNANGEVVGIVTAMLGLRNETTGTVELLPNQSSAVKIGSLRRLMDQLPAKDTHVRAPFEPGLPIQTLSNQLKDSMLVVIVRGDSG